VDDLLLLQYVQEVSKLADPANPRQARQTAFDAAAKQDQRFADLPLARDIARQLQRSWRDVLAFAHAPSRGQPASLSGRLGTDKQPLITGESIAYALKLVAHRLQVRELSERQYEEGREALRAEHQRRHPRSERWWLPTGTQIRVHTQAEIHGTTAFGTSFADTWHRALELAELTPHRKRTRQQPLTTSVSLELLDQFYETHGVEPTPERLATFARKQGVTLGVVRNKGTWGKILDAWRASRRKRSLPVLTEPPPPPTLAEQRFAAQTIGTRSRSSKSKWGDPEKCLQIILMYLRQIPAGKYATGRDYERWAKEQRFPVPCITSLDRHGGWDKLRVIAHKRMINDAKKTSAS